MWAPNQAVAGLSGKRRAAASSIEKTDTSG